MHFRRLWLMTVVLAVWQAGAPAFAQLDFLSGKLSSQTSGGAQSGQKVSTSARIEPGRGAQPARLLVTAKMATGWHIYSITQSKTPDGLGPIASKIKLDPSDEYRVLGKFSAIVPPEVHRDEAWSGLRVEEHAGEVTWQVPIELAKGIDPSKLSVSGAVYAQACENSCIPPQDYRFATQSGVPGASTAQAPGIRNPGTIRALPPAITYEVVELTNASQSTSLLAILGYGFLGGLILNLMPCVLPVIGLKILSFVEQGGHNRAKVLFLNLMYAAGMLVVFMVLATLAVTLNFGWGQHFGSAAFNITICAVVFAMALSFLGVWEIPIPGFVGRGNAVQVASREGALGAFAKGVLTTVLATPCSGPYLGSVFAFIVKQPPHITYMVFAAIGLGMASPYLLIGAFPQLIRLLPKPGAWMDTFKQLMGFVLLGTVVFLFTFMDPKYVVPTFALLVGIWAGCWWIGRTPLTVSSARRMLAWLEGAATAAVVGSLAFSYLMPQDHVLPWQKFSESRLQELSREGKTVLVEFTANWCPNCIWNMKYAIDTDAVGKVVEKNGVVPLLADWSDGSETIHQMITALKGNSIPLLAIFPADQPGKALVLRDLISQRQLLDALREAGPSEASSMARQPDDKSTSGTPPHVELDLSRR